MLNIVAVPVLITFAWIAFPFLEERNLGYAAWHQACFLGFAFTGLGTVCWVAEKLSRRTPQSWFVLVTLLGLGLTAVALRFFGDFYWAFERGYFLD